MATKSPPAHVLRATRKLYGYSQQKLATLVGCSLATVKFVETGRLRPSPSLAHRVYIATGLDPHQLIGNFSPDKPRGPDGPALTKDTIRFRQEARLPNDQTREQVDGILRQHSAVEETLLDASVLNRKLWAVRAAYQIYMNKLINDFDLGKDFRRMLIARYGVRDPWDVFETRLKKAARQRDEFYNSIQELPARKKIPPTAA